MRVGHFRKLPRLNNQNKMIVLFALGRVYLMLDVMSADAWMTIRETMNENTVF